ncbi:NUDIX domain-containing protein [Patescibacteria group bacterium]|nr:NUDIX domain-containing protein [Patescibacteria group bacterium]
MQAPFYVSGFLYNPKTHQILLIQSKQKTEDTDVQWSMLEGEGTTEEKPQVVFQRIVNQLLKINLKPKKIYSVYDYFHKKRNEHNFIFYTEIKNIKKIRNLKKSNLSWFKFSETSKLSFTKQTKQDVIVGERVVNAKWREMRLAGKKP